MTPYFEQGGITIYHGDCRDVLPTLEPGSVDLVLTDPPFYLPARIHACRRAWPRTLADVGIMNSYFRDTFAALAGVLRRTGALYTFSDSTSYAVFLSCLYPVFDRTQCVVWDKGVGGLGNGWRHSTELIVHAAFSETLYASGFRRDVLRCPVVPSEKRHHPAEKPLPLLRDILGAHPAGTVLDPYCGSGPTLEAALLNGWCAIGVDVEEANCEIAAKRLQQQVLPLEVPV